MYVLVYATKTKLQNLFDKGAVEVSQRFNFYFINGKAIEHCSIIKTQRCLATCLNQLDSI